MTDSRYSDFRTTIYGTFFLCAILLIIGISIILFCPQKKGDLATVEGEIIPTEIPQNVALEIAYTANFLTDSYTDTDFIPGVNRLAVLEFLNLTNTVSDDKGLQLYRNPQTRGAVEWFYIRITGSRDIAHAILTAADRENIPLTLAFSLAYTESRYNHYARNTNTNGSIDRGLFQLNDRSFPQLEDDDFFSPSVSAQYGMRHLRYCRAIAGDDLVAVAMYNAGVTRVKNNQTPKSTLTYVSNIARYRAVLDVEFEKEVVSMFENVPNGPEL
ncbi:MAG: lytic transglycosylase domain-containing protein [Treponema sp.]|uniref:transglycosylase SLT domain-containing protein n=1 Tax=Treponema sp. TaxID=166 RepID=UPI001B49263D|nr:transglycosylase SLT domain-containing protein [Treponema sp.]MBP5403307.1 lytic transglycosylase domain-containing protein [Treponema sp.]MBR5932649.1 lytic transglycosylase domain-containing protein [Treponema sp.]